MNNKSYFCPVVAGDLAERLVAVDDGIVDDLSVCQEETAVGYICPASTVAPSHEGIIEKVKWKHKVK